MSILQTKTITLAPEPCHWWLWLSPIDGIGNTLLIDMSAYPDYAEFHEAIALHDHGGSDLCIGLHNAVTGGVLQVDWVGSDTKSDPIYGRCHKFWTSAHGGITVELWEHGAYIAAARALLGL